MDKKFIFIFAIIAILAISVFVAARPKWQPDPCPITEDTDIVFYGDTGFGGVGTLSRNQLERVCEEK